jgi:HTH-type transcriptional regulator/antitoxin HigA
MNIKPIRTPADHAAVLKQLERLWDAARPGTPEGDKFEVLSALVDAYEREHIRIPAPDPIEAIRFRMEQEGLTTKDLLPIFKTRARASEVMAKKRRLNLPMIRRLHARLAIPVECLVQEYKLKKARGAPRPGHPPAAGEPSWTELRDCLLAALLGAAARRPPSDDELRIATEALAERSVRVAEILARFPAVFHRAEDGSLRTTLDLAQAYRLRLARYWEPAPRDVMRKVLARLSSIMDGKDHLVLADLPKQIAMVVKDGISEREVSHILQMVRRAEGWEIVSIAGNSKRRVQPKPWLRDPVQAEAHIDDAAVAVMGPFAPVDRAAMAAALSRPQPAD